MAITDARSALSNEELIAAADAAGDAILAVTSHPSPMVVVALPLSIDAVAVLLAAISADFSVCFLDPSAPEERRERVIESLGPEVLVDAGGVHRHRGPRTVARTDSLPGYVAVSSGSTGGPPKGVLSPWSTIAAFAPFGADAFELDRDSAWAEISHLAYDMAMTNLLVALWSGATIHVSAALGDRLRPLRFIERVQATHLRLAPRYVDLAAAERRPRGTTLRLWASGGDRLFAVQARQVFEFGVPMVVNTYGTSETAGFASTARLTAEEPLTTVHGSVTIGGGEVGAWRTDLVAHGCDSMLNITTPYRPQGYLLGRSTGEFPRWEGSDSIVTGDVGAEAGGDLFCLGRLGRRVKRNATFVDLDEVDAMIRSASGVVSFTVARSDGTLSSVVEVRSDGVEQLRQLLPSVLRPEILPERLVPVAQLPRLGNGKVDLATAQALAEGEM